MDQAVPDLLQTEIADYLEEYNFEETHEFEEAGLEIVGFWETTHYRFFAKKRDSCLENLDLPRCLHTSTANHL